MGDRPATGDNPAVADVVLARGVRLDAAACTEPPFLGALGATPP